MTAQPATPLHTRAWSLRLGSWTTKLFVLLLFAILTVGMTYPLILNLRTAVPGPPWDNFVWLYDLWWFRHSIVDLNEWPTINPTIFYPFGYDLRLSETTLATKLLAAPFLFWGDEILAYNAVLLLSFVLTAYATYLLISYLTDNGYAAIVGAAIFAFCPFRMHAMAAGWLPLMATQWIPLTFLYLERTLRDGKARYALAAGLFMALTVLSSWYYLYIVGPAVALYLLMRMGRLKGSIDRAQLTRNLMFAGFVILVMVLPVALPVVMQQSGAMGWSVADVEKWAASADDFFIPNVYHPFWGEYFLSLRAETLRYPWYAPGFVYLGVVALLLAAGALGRKRGASDITRPFVWLAVLFFLIGLGLVLHWGNEVVAVRVPENVETWYVRIMSTLMSKLAWHKASLYDFAFEQGTVPIPLPALLVYLFVPLGNAMRTFYRFGVITIFAVSVLAGIGAAQILGGSRAPDVGPKGKYDMAPPPDAKRKSRPSIATATAILLGLVLFDFCSIPLPYGMSDIKPQPLDRWLAAHPDDVVLMQFPTIRALSGDSLYRTKFHGKRVAYGHGTFYPDKYVKAMPTLATFPSEQSLKLLKSWGVTHIAVGSQAYDAGWGDQQGQNWEVVRAQIEATKNLKLVGVTYDEPFWRDERVSGIIYGSPPVVPILVDKVYVYELR